jgi:hypothetical protein
VSPVNLLQNKGLTDADTGGQTSTVGEPTVANSDHREILLAGNWYASRSLDAGGSWSLLDPFTLFPPVAGGFCCDQVVTYDPRRNLIFWLLQYVRDPQGTNVLRLAVTQGGTLASNNWYWWDFAPGTTNAAWAGEWFDYPDLELGDGFLYITTNSFRGDQWRRSVVFRLPLQALAAHSALNYRYFATTQNFSLRCVRGAAATMYFASHNSTSQLRVFSWPEKDRVSFRDVNVTTWNAGSYSAPGPDNTNWLARCDPRITGAWLGNGAIWLAWTANSRGQRPFPYARIVEISEAQMQVQADRDIWSPSYAYAYPNGSPNDGGETGITLFRGGNQLNPSHVVGVFNRATNKWSLRATKNGTNGPADNKWGDYLTCRRYASDGQTWLASGYTLQGGGTRNDVEPRIVHFDWS